MLRARRTRAVLRWLLLLIVTVAVTVPLTLINVPSAALFAALIVGVVLAIAALAPPRVPRQAGVVAQGVLGVYIGTMVHQDAVDALQSDWGIVLAIAVATLVISIVAGALLGLHRDVSPLTGSLALVAGGASGLVAIARELGGDDRVVSVVQYLRVALVTATIPLVVTVVFHADRSHPAVAPPQTEVAPWYLSLAMLVGLVVVGAVGGRLLRMPGAGLLGPLALTVVLQLTGLSSGLTVPAVLVQAGYMVIGWQAGVAFTRESLRAIGRILPLALLLIVLLGAATALLGVVLADVTGMTQLEGYLATSPGGVYAVLATAVETGSNVTFVIAAQVLRVLLMLFTAPLLARTMIRLTGRRAEAVDVATPARR
ncbi:AbrB family transcriptional regulator [Mycolicibacterium goodii]|uniref:AbrB family transcriptional regulator n=2 Tax=Mycolicibacterium goodii TaxID=134601 RepID=A0ABS6HL87_MYCGD|nr:AbrB family transcriptional regulator [Mycolicibacterium goodii]OKH72262.1 membrane protein [Mycobacterium sp. SWH-M5]MBU8810081.1 AbrB family transcriptional regulator [Mycolicibacterium goodii]MBU8818389.1 AbrB family transcriptional regulator [Mycolicibacterium goodii]MBU8821962.1 AbrB family transcriptional regulator [Mycolicibacterium goodii]MBU8828456.1 AbrB family transcriptional regulator [Mycolicibacterium goodii]